MTKSILNIDKTALTFTYELLYEASLESVYKAYTDSMIIPLWRGPRNLNTYVDKLDVKLNGKWRFIQTDINGKTYAFNGIYRVVIPCVKLVNTFEWEEMPGHIILDTTIFSYENNKTKIVTVSQFSSLDDLEGMLNSGMEFGLTQSIERLCEYLDFIKNKNNPIIIQYVFNVPKDEIWSALTDIDKLRQWYLDLTELKPEKGYEFKFYMGEDNNKKYWHLCKILEVEKNKKLSYSWKFEGLKGESIVTFDLSEFDGATTVRLTHDGIETFPTDIPDLSRENFIEGWTFIITKNLKEFLIK